MKLCIGYNTLSTATMSMFYHISMVLPLLRLQARRWAYLERSHRKLETEHIIENMLKN